MLDMEKPKHVHAQERLEKSVIAWFCTVRPDGRPHVVPVWFLWDDGTVLVFSKPDQKIRNLRENSRVLIALDDTDEGDDVVTFEGEATLLPEGEVTLANIPAYLEKYGERIASFNWTPESMASQYSQAIRVKPARFIF